MGNKVSPGKRKGSDENDAVGLERRNRFANNRSRSNISTLIQAKSRFVSKNRSVSSMNMADKIAMISEPLKYSFDFENLVLEGGGNKGLAYCGALKYLQEVGIMRKIKRIAGASAGAMTAALIIVGYSPDEIEDFLSNNISEVFIDHTCGFFSLIPNLLSGYGWNPGKKIFKWFGEKMKIKTGDEDITFREVYDLTGMELCVIVTNLNQMSTEYCHPKTTPDMPVRLAVRMSMAIPGMFTAMKYTKYNQTDVYVDGGVLCNYPIHCFDGWYLSMEKEDSFLARLRPLRDLSKLYDIKERFGKFNPKTLGFLLFSENERDVLRHYLEQRIGALKPIEPSKETKLYKNKMKEINSKDMIDYEHGKVIEAVDMLLFVLQKHDLDKNGTISRPELETAFNDDQLTKDHIRCLFGENADWQTAFSILDKDNNGHIKFSELMTFMESIGVCLQSRFLGYERKNVTSFVSFLDSLQSTLLTNLKNVYVSERDLDRTVGINTGHVGTTDFKLEEADIEFAVQRGYNATKAFLQYHMANKQIESNKDIDSLLNGVRKDLEMISEA